MESCEFNLVLHETLAYALWNKPFLLNKILKCYAAHKFSAIISKKRENNSFYETVCIQNIKMSTERRMINNIIISFTAKLKLLSPSFTPEIKEEYTIEREHRRYINPSHPLLVQKLNVSCNDFSDMKFITREIEILFQNYRCCINLVKDTFTIQYKKQIHVNEVYLTKTLTREFLFSSIEGPVFSEPQFVVNKENNDEILGVASFLESSNIAIKTLYLEKGSTKLYQRICPDNYSKSYPFILEYELDGKNDANASERNYFELGWRLNGALPNFNSKNEVLPKSSKPIHVLNQNDKQEKVYLKFDGIPCTLQFYPNHFVLYNTNFSSSYNHTLPPNFIYILKDYRFLAESNLYENDNVLKPKPLVIIDIQTCKLNAFERMEQIQRLRKSEIAFHLYDYYIFFQGEILFGDGYGIEKRLVFNDDDIKLKHGSIYEVLLNPNNKMNVVRVIKERLDKTKPNSSKIINTIFELLQQ